MKKKILLTIILTINVLICSAQFDRKVQNKPYIDLRPFHFGVILGTHLQDIELNNIGPQQITLDDGTTKDILITADQNRWEPGLTVGVLGELRLNTYFQVRLAPAMYFGNKHLSFKNFTDLDANGLPTEKRQNMKMAYISSALNLIFAAPRFNNHRPYLMAGINPMMNLSSKNNLFIALKRHEIFAEVGVGCDFYLQFFKLRPELKFMFGLTNSYDSKHANSIKDKNLLPYAQAINKATTKMIALSFYFE